MRPTQIFIVNAGLNNSGDLLMAIGAMSMLREIPGLRFFLNGKRVSPKRPAALRIVVEALPGAAARRLGLFSLRRRNNAKLDQVPGIGRGDMVLDVNGYRHGWRWPAKNLEMDIALLSRAKAVGASVIHLPKSYGPFEEAQKPLMRDLFRLVDLAFARDRFAFAHASEVVSDAGMLRLEPDHSSFGSPEKGMRADPIFRGAIVLIPNHKLVEAGSFSDVGSHFEFLKTLVSLPAFGAFPKIVLFHQGRDYALYRGKCESARIPYRFSDRPLQTRSNIGAAEFVITGRYHGMVNALTQEVPCAVLSWSQKYQGYLEFFDLDGLRISDLADAKEKIDHIFRERRNFVSRIEKGKAVIRGRNAATAGLIRAFLGARDIH